MTLKEKFESIEFSFPADESEKIADDFAIGFAEWLLRFDNLKNESKYIIEQLLKIYKEETGL